MAPLNYAATGLRVYVSLSILSTCFISWSTTDSITARAVIDGEPIGVAFLTMSTVLALVALFDSVINGARWIPLSSEVTKRWRQLGFMLMSIVSACTAYAVLQDYGYHPVIVRYILDACAAVTVAVLGLRELYQEPFNRRVLPV